MTKDKAPLYTSDIDPLDRRRVQVIVSQLIPEGSRVLELGCAGGRVSQLLKQRGCTVVGLEIDPELASMARNICDKVYEMDVDSDAFKTQVEGGFDAVLCTDVLEHFKDPWRVLKILKDKLKPQGLLVTAIPNFLIWRYRLKYLRGWFEYDPKGGILDWGHIRFFSFESARRMVEESGFSLTLERFAPDIPYLNRLIHKKFQKNPQHAPSLYERASQALARRWPGLLSTHFIFTTRAQ